MIRVESDSSLVGRFAHLRSHFLSLCCDVDLHFVLSETNDLGSLLRERLVLLCEPFQFFADTLVAVFEASNEHSCLASLMLRQKSVSNTVLCSGSSSPSYPVHMVIFIGCAVKVHDCFELNRWNVKTPGGQACCHQHWELALSEPLYRYGTIHLLFLTVQTLNLLVT